MKKTWMYIALGAVGLLAVIKFFPKIKERVMSWVA